VSFAFVACIVLVPSLLALWKERSTDDLGDRQFVPQRVLTGLSGFLLRRQRAIVAVTLGIVVVGAFGALRMTPQLDNIDYLRRTSDIYKSSVFLEKNLVGTTQLDIWIESGKEGLMKEPATLRKIEDLCVFLRGFPGVDKVLSINDYLKEMNEAFNGDDPAHYVLPDTREKTAQFMLLYSMAGRKNELDNYLDYPCSRTRVSVRCSERRSWALDVLIRKMQEYLAANFEKPLEARLASNALVVNNVFNYVMKGLAVGLGVAVFLIFVVMCINFRSVKVGLVSMIPNVIPLVAAMALMGYFDIWLEIASAMTFSIALGIAVDDTIHFLARFREQLPAAGYDYAVAVRRTLEDLGSALTETTTIIVGGFMVLLMASLRMNVQFGLLCSFIVAMALVADMVFTPICMVLFRPFGKGAR
jgi:predicted RND superfamily exporter protein